MIAPDATTIDYLRGRDMAPKGEAFDEAAEKWLHAERFGGRA